MEKFHSDRKGQYRPSPGTDEIELEVGVYRRLPYQFYRRIICITADHIETPHVRD